MAGVKTLLALILRRDRIKLPLVLTLLITSLWAMIPLLRDVYGDDQSLATMYATFGINPAGLFMTGPMDAPTFGAFMTIETVLWWGLVVAFINTMLVVRHTRHNEEIGAQELLLSGQAHRASGLVAAVVASLVVNVIIAVGIGAGVQLFNPGWSAEQSWLYGVAFGAFGLVWASIASVIVQLVESGRAANSSLAALIGLGFMVRGVGDFLGKVGDSGLHEPAWASLLSPFGWLQLTRPLVEPDWSPLLISLAASGLLFGLALALLARRDVGAGLLPSRRGRARASRLLATPLGLAWKLQRNIFIGWLVGVLVMVGTIGALVPQMSDVYSDSEQLMAMIESIGGVGELIPSFMSAMIAITALMVFAYTVQGLMRLRSEESTGHLENLLATRLSRIGWAAGHVAIVVAGGLLMLAVVGSGLALMTNSMTDVTVEVSAYVLAGLAYVPVMLFFAGLYLLLFGILPRAASLLTWLYFGFVAFVSWLGPILQLDQMIMKLSVMDYLSSPPVETINLMPVLAISLIASLMAATGMLSWRRRNLLER